MADAIAASEAHSTSPRFLIQGRFRVRIPGSAKGLTYREYLQGHPPKDYKPAWYLPSGHLQTAMSTLFGEGPPVEYDRELLTLPDGGTIALDWIPDRKSRMQCPELVVILHGIAGGSSARYIYDLVAATQHRRDVPIVVINSRGCAGTTLTSPRLYHAGTTDDLSTAVRHIRRSRPGVRKIMAIGFSLGANQLIKFLGQTGEDCPFHAAVAVCCPFDFADCAEKLHSTFVGREIYSRGFAHKLNSLVMKHLSVLSTHSSFSNYDWHETIKSICTIYEFDELFTSPAWNFEGADDYYRSQSCKKWIAPLRTPLLCLNDLDDPIVPGTSIPINDLSSNNYTSLLLTQNGGHMAWYDQPSQFGSQWCSVTLAEHIDAMLSVDVVHD